jgi:hypothetical protein
MVEPSTAYVPREVEAPTSAALLTIVIMPTEHGRTRANGRRANGRMGAKLKANDLVRLLQGQLSARRSSHDRPDW